LEELEGHLREEIEQQIKSGLNEAKAFETAIQKIGQAGMVQGEFKKIADGKDALRWRFIETGFGLFASAMPLCLCFQVLYAPARSAADLTPGQQLSGVLAMLTFAALAWGGRLSYKMFPVITSKRGRDVITSLCAGPVMLWWVIFMNLIVPHHDFTMGQFVVAFLWAFAAPAGLVIGLPWGMETAARKRMAAVTAQT
jgi:hypothetical protein